jgi:precorrin-6B methylase 2
MRRYHLAESVWIETGTYNGDTTAFLAKFASHVWSIEPAVDLANKAKTKFAHYDNVTIVEGLSEEKLNKILENLRGNVCLWLDGHYSSGETFLGPSRTPIKSELEAIALHLDKLSAVLVMIDDVRCFGTSVADLADYPEKSYLVNWAEGLGLAWTIEYDIFLASNVRDFS